jgi:hypothetical protein
MEGVDRRDKRGHDCEIELQKSKTRRGCRVLLSAIASRFASFLSRFQNTRFQSRRCRHHCGGGVS